MESVMSFFDTVLVKKFDNERDLLTTLRIATEKWFNTLTTPLLPILTKRELPQDKHTENRYRTIAEALLKEAFLVNAGDEVKNILDTMGSRGFFRFTSRDALRPLMERYLESGLFLKKLVFGFDPEEAANQWCEFKAAKDELVNEINRQLSNLGR